MSAEILRRAAAKMRERAEAATPGPWWGEGVWWEHWTDVEGRRCHTPFPLVGHGGTGADVIARVASTDEDRHHIASWHPDVALAVAKLLDAQASLIEQYGEFIDDEDDGVDLAALAAARAYLGSES